MSLRIWLPMTKDLRNQGLDDVTVTNNGATVDNNGKLGKCYSFDGTSKYISLTNPLDDASEVSCSVWVKPSTNTSTNEQIMNVGTSSGWSNIRFGILQRSVNQFIFHVSDGTNNIAYSCVSGTITVDQWIHIGCVYKDKTLKMYLNGELVKTYSISFNPSFSGISKIGIGAAPNGAEKFTGFITDFRLYDHELSPLEVKRLSQGLVLHYPLNRGGCGQENLASQYIMPGNNNPSSTATSGRTNYYGDYGIIIPATENADTYFSLWYTEPLENGQTYTLSANVSGLIDGTTYNFPLFAQNNSSMGMIVFNHNGRNGLTFTMNYTGNIVTTTLDGKTYYKMFMDDNGRTITSGQGAITIKNFKLEKGDKPTPWCPNKNDELATTMGLDDGIEYDCSGFGNNGTRVGDFSWNSDTPRYHTSTYMPKAALITHPRPVFGGTDQEWTCAMWVKLDTVNQSGIAMNNFNDGNNIVHSANGMPLLYLNSGSNDYYMYGKKAINANEWTHIVFVFRNSDALRNIYINGELSNNYGPNKTSTPSGIQDIITIGSNLAGYISDYRIYATALSADDILALYNLGGSIDNNGTFHTYEYVEG